MRQDVAIVGGGIAGASLAAALAADGLAVTVLEASEEYRDRVRGESMVPWGVKEAREVGAEEVLLAAGARITPTWLQYDEQLPREVTEANPIPAGMMVPDVPGTLNLRHPDACQALIEHAAACGARVVRGVTDVKLQRGPRPELTFTAGGHAGQVAADLVVGADGRNSTVRRQTGIPLERQEETNMMAGLLVETDGLPEDCDWLAGEADLFMAAFQQPGGRVRIYLCPPASDRHRFAGSGAVEEFLRAAAFKCLPFGEALSTGTPAGPLATYPGDDTWAPRPFARGVVLIGDAAGHNNPIIGQGLSISMRDVRLVRDAIREHGPGDADFSSYATERLERMRRLRCAATFMAAAFGEDAEDRSARRARFFELQQTEPLILGLLGGLFTGPEAGPPEAFDGRLLATLRGQDPAVT